MNLDVLDDDGVVLASVAACPPPSPRRFLSSSSIQAPVKRLEPREQVRVVLQRQVTFGLSLSGPADEVHPTAFNLGVYVKGVEAKSPAAESGKLCAGVRLLSLNGVDVSDACMPDCGRIMKQAHDTLEVVGVYDPYGYKSHDAGNLLRKEVIRRLEMCSREQSKQLGKAYHLGCIDLEDRRGPTVDAAVGALVAFPETKAQEVAISLSDLALELMHTRRKSDATATAPLMTRSSLAYGGAITIHDISNVWLLGRKSVVIVARSIEGGNSNHGASDDAHAEMPCATYGCHVIKCRKAKHAVELKNTLQAACRAHVQMVQRVFAFDLEV
ncbi:hypothetical protein PTSG_06827 [Salpingoeca rosetta]|uniref:PDZ domain-containing protein n=1 Tax=Salpingoeca rosetta (strain ATCC 50818 / BSB-021) TaxID=946362 RepID=F2UEX4_SALR5|nr:uncharacterized protein PTSG_06827 [Salpingoeca rosetta]EGD75174.1 hypothetical protein PTSG_06827 [Salpingoeca rosetta]|eukprot:XP_004992227.1 hypothetical protein PTSG_06827 [Salpingoeca rosetta]